MRIFKVLACCAVTMMPLEAKAEASGDEFLKQIRAGGESKRVTGLYLHGVHAGLMWALVWNKVRNNEQMYCPPANMVMEQEQVISIFTKYLKDKPQDGQHPAGAVMILALQYTFPCP